MSLTAIDALQEIRRQLAKKKAEEVPPGFKTSKEWAEEAKCDRYWCEVTLGRAVAANIVEMRTFVIALGGSVRRVKHYRMIETKKKK